MANQLKRIGSNLKQEEIREMMFSLTDKLHEGIVMVDENWDVLYANPSAYKLLFSTKGDIQGHSLWSILPKSLQTNNAVHLLHKAMEKSIATDFNEFYQSTKAWFHIQVFPMKLGLTIHLQETTEQKVAMEVTGQAYRTLFNEHPDAVCSIDLKGRFLSINTAFKELFRVDEKLMLGEPFLLFIPDDMRAAAQELFEMAKKGVPITKEFNLTKQVGYPFFILVTAIPIFANSQIIGSYGIIKDITEDQRNMEEVQRLYQMNTLIMESVEDGILGLDLQSNVVMWNDAAERITGFQREDLTKEKLKELLNKLGTTDHPLFKQGFNNKGNLTKETVVQRSGATFYRKDQSPFICEYTISPMISGSEVVGSVLTFRDITEKKKSEEMLRQSEKLSEMGQLAAGIAHEIRNPLTSLKGFLQLIEKNEGAKDEYFEIMNSEFSRIEQILNELLILSKPEKQKKKKTSLNKLLNHTITLLSTQAVIKNIEVVSEISKTDVAYILSLEHKIKQVFINLIKNAIEAMDAGGKIIVSLEKVNESAVIKIIDEGCGIPSTILKRIGDPFFTTKEKGTGLGLMVTYQIIKDHGGQVEVESVEGAGTTFTVQLPLLDPSC
ncbi:PAS domain S-box-containing protein [Evansella vedderi]|uniref:histidine kinase n=1 Tax=Evansella vedderi TaxID=38282 RepID=A0ABU0A187_9BACI|nr:PAS domain S-box protein [Evansella vedderi]MDQ0257253.1 PAS domain S-box-containing protein [Evansella vedderi]